MVVVKLIRSPFQQAISMIKHILFDCDGVLIDTEIVAAHRFVARVQKIGITVSVDHYLTHHTGSTFSAVLEHYLGDSHSLQQRTDIMDEVEREVAENTVGITGVEPMLAALSINKSIVSNSLIATVNDAMVKLGLTNYFTGHVFSSESVARPKPAPDVYNLALKTLDLNRDELIVVEDSITGATAAREAGLDIVGFAGASHILPGHAEKLEKLGVKSVAKDMSELTRILQGIVG